MQDDDDAVIVVVEIVDIATLLRSPELRESRSRDDAREEEDDSLLSVDS